MLEIIAFRSQINSDHSNDVPTVTDHPFCLIYYSISFPLLCFTFFFHIVGFYLKVFWLLLFSCSMITCKFPARFNKYQTYATKNRYKSISQNLWYHSLSFQSFCFQSLSFPNLSFQSLWFQRFCIQSLWLQSVSFQSYCFQNLTELLIFPSQERSPWTTHSKLNQY